PRARPRVGRGARRGRHRGPRRRPRRRGPVEPELGRAARDRARRAGKHGRAARRAGRPRARAGRARRAARGRARAAPRDGGLAPRGAPAAGPSPGPREPTMSELFPEPPARFVEVALPVPLRRRFTYRVPDHAASPPVGARVAVPFHGRKLAGFVLGHPEQPPAGVKVVKPLAGVLDDEPLFPEELLRFLVEAADYYLHPIGEVLRAAAPPMATEALRALRAEGFLERGESLGGA